VTILKQDSLALIMLGATHTIDMGGKQASIFYETAERAHMMLPDGTHRHGSWHLSEDGYTVAWLDGPTAAWKLDHRPGAIAYVDATGVERGTLVRIEFGDSAGIAA